MITSEFANEYLFKKISIEPITNIKMTSFKLDDLFGETLPGWVTDPQGINTGGWGISLTPRDMNKIGSLFMTKGMVQNQTILSYDWVEASTREQVEGYGYLWWIKTVQGYQAFAALGYGGNIICCIPELTTVIVSTGKMSRNTIDPWELIDNVLKIIR